MVPDPVLELPTGLDASQIDAAALAFSQSVFIPFDIFGTIAITASVDGSSLSIVPTPATAGLFAAAALATGRRRR